MRYLYSLLLVASLDAQTAMYPGATATDAQLKVAGNLVQNTLKSAVRTVDTVLIVNSSVGFVPNMIVTIDGEEISICGVAGNLLTIGVSSCPNFDGRGVDATTPASHALAAPVVANIDAWHHNAMRVELQATQNKLTATTATANLAQAASVGDPFNVHVAAYKFGPLVPTGSPALSAGASATVTLAPVPAGVNGSDSWHMLYLSGGTGTAEAVAITGGTAIAGHASGTLTFTPAHAHSGAYTLTSATDGASEAISALTTAGGGLAQLPCAATTVIRAPLWITSNITLAGCGWSSIVQLGVGVWPFPAVPPHWWDAQSGLSAVGAIAFATNPTFRNFALDMNGTHQLTGDVGTGISVTNATHGLIENIRVFNMNQSGRTFGCLGNAGRDCTVRDSFSDGTGGTTGLCAGGIFVQSPSSTVENNFLHGLCDEGIICSNGGQDGCKVSHNTVYGDVPGVGTALYHIENGQNVSMSDNIAAGNGNAFFIGSATYGNGAASKNISLTGNQVFALPGFVPISGVICHGINGANQEYPQWNITIADNVIDGASSGIVLDNPADCNGVSIHHNVLRNLAGIPFYTSALNRFVNFQYNTMTNNGGGTANSGQPTVVDSGLSPGGDIILSPNYGDATYGLSGISFNEPMGVNVVSAATITPTGRYFSVTGTATITTIAPFSQLMQTGAVITLVPVNAFSLGAGGNISMSGTKVATPYVPVTCVWGVTWFCSVPTQ